MIKIDSIGRKTSRKFILINFINGSIISIYLNNKIKKFNEENILKYLHSGWVARNVCLFIVLLSVYIHWSVWSYLFYHIMLFRKINECEDKKVIVNYMIHPDILEIGKKMAINRDYQRFVLVSIDITSDFLQTKLQITELTCIYNKWQKNVIIINE
jgi:hypothetical protein